MKPSFRNQIQVHTISKFIVVFLVYSVMLFCIPIPTRAETAINAGFVSGIWYSQFPFFAGDTVRVYIAFQNQSGGDISGKIEFFDNEESIGVKNFSAINGRVVESWTDFIPDQGQHVISARLSNVYKTVAGSEPQSITIESKLISSEKILVDIDTDNDNIGDSDDSDDDGDTWSDEEEIERGTDPLDANNHPANTATDEAGNENISGTKIVETVKNVTNDTFETINTNANTWNEKIYAEIVRVETELIDLKTRKTGLEQTIIEGQADITTPSEIKSIKKDIAIKSVTLYLLKTIYTIIKYKLLLYIVIVFIIYIVGTRTWRLIRR